MVVAVKINIPVIYQNMIPTGDLTTNEGVTNNTPTTDTLTVTGLNTGENQTTWLLLLEVVQYTDQQERFEELAVEYAMTFEESPPSWEPPPAATASQIDAAVLAVEMTDIYVLEGEILGPNTEALRKITAFAARPHKVEVDCTRMRRMDFVSAVTLFNIVRNCIRKAGWWC